jgi:hypothetical protein
MMCQHYEENKKKNGKARRKIKEGTKIENVAQG